MSLSQHPVSSPHTASSPSPLSSSLLFLFLLPVLSLPSLLPCLHSIFCFLSSAFLLCHHSFLAFFPLPFLVSTLLSLLFFLPLVSISSLSSLSSLLLTSSSPLFHLSCPPLTCSTLSHLSFPPPHTPLSLSLCSLLSVHLPSPSLPWSQLRGVRGVSGRLAGSRMSRHQGPLNLLSLPLLCRGSKVDSTPLNCAETARVVFLCLLRV